jgi:alcohol dehydrogenase
MKAWRLDRPGGKLTFEDLPMPELRRGTVLIKIQAVPILTYLKSYVDGKLPFFRAPNTAFTPGPNGVGVIESVGRDVWHLKRGQRVILSPHLISAENVEDPSQILLGLTVIHAGSEAMQLEWPDGTLAEFVLAPVSAVTPVDGLDSVDAVKLGVLNRFVVPFGGLLRGRLAPGETLVVNGASGDYGTAAVLLGIAMGAEGVVAAGRNAAVLDAVVRTAGCRVTSVKLTGDVQTDIAALRAASGGGAHIAYDMVGGAGGVGAASDANSTLASLCSLRRGGRLVLAGNVVPPIPVPYGDVCFNDWEIIGQFMYPSSAYRRLLSLLRAGLFDPDAIKARSFSLASLPEAMDAAEKASNFECVVVQP